MTDHGREECVDAADFIVLAGDLQLRHGIDAAAVPHVVVCSLLRKLVANVLLNLNERAFVRSSGAIFDVHPDNTIILVLNIQSCLIILLVSPDVNSLHIRIGHILSFT